MSVEKVIPQIEDVLRDIDEIGNEAIRNLQACLQRGDGEILRQRLFLDTARRGHLPDDFYQILDGVKYSAFLWLCFKWNSEGAKAILKSGIDFEKISESQGSSLAASILKKEPITGIAFKKTGYARACSLVIGILGGDLEICEYLMSDECLIIGGLAHDGFNPVCAASKITWDGDIRTEQSRLMLITNAIRIVLKKMPHLLHRKDENGKILLYYSLDFGYDRVEMTLECHVEDMKLVSDLESRALLSSDCFAKAVWLGHRCLFSKFITLGFMPYGKSSQGITIFDLAVLTGEEEIVGELLDMEDALRTDVNESVKSILGATSIAKDGGPPEILRALEGALAELS